MSELLDEITLLHSKEVDIQIAILYGKTQLCLSGIYVRIK